MNKEFIIVDRLNSVAFQCSTIVRFRFNNIDYLVYYSYENDNKCKVFASRIICNGNNKFSLKDITSDEKSRISNIVSVIIVTFPSAYSKNLDINKFVNDFTTTNNISFSKDIPNFEEQSLFVNSFFANSNIDYLNYVKSFYNYIISNANFSNRSSLTWSIPSSEQGTLINKLDNITESSKLNTMSTSNGNILIDNLDVIIPINGTDTKDVSNSGISVSLSSNSHDVLNKVDLSDNSSVNNNLNTVYSSNDFGFNYVPNNQENSLNTIKLKSSINKFVDKKKAGFASNVYIIIGTVSLTLASIVVAVAIIITKNLR